MYKYIVGIDPGFGETGVVLYRDDDEQKILRWATFSCPPRGQAAAARAASLAEHVINELLVWFEFFNVQLVDISLELPVMGANVAAFQKQMRVLQEIESGILFRLAGEVKELWVTEVGPTQSKLLSTNNGAAPKKQVVQASPFRAMLGSVDTIEAIADAWSHGLAAWGVKGGRFNFSSIKAAKVVRQSDQE